MPTHFSENSRPEEMNKHIRDGMLDFLDAVSCGMLCLELNGRYRYAYMRDGRRGIHRLLDWEEQRDLKIRAYRAKKRGLVTEKKIGKNLTLALTGEGLEMFERKAMHFADRRKDGKHVCVMYDIPEKFHALRDQLRRILKRAGFRRFQQSVWHSDRDVAALLKDWVRRHKLKKWVDISII